MDRRIWWTVSKWTAGIIGYVIGGVILAIAGSFVITIAFVGGDLDDAPGTGLFGMFIAGLLFALALLFGVLLLVEIVYSRLFSDRRIRRLRLLLRVMLGALGLAGPLWILLFWPPIPYRNSFQSRPIEFVIEGVGAVLLLAAICIPFRFRSSSPRHPQVD